MLFSLQLGLWISQQCYRDHIYIYLHSYFYNQIYIQKPYVLKYWYAISPRIAAHMLSHIKKPWSCGCNNAMNHTFCSGESKKPSRLNYRVRVWSRIICTMVSCYYRSRNFANMSLATVCGRPNIIVMPWQDMIKSCRTGVHSHMHFGDEMELMIIIIPCSIMSMSGISWISGILFKISLWYLNVAIHIPIWCSLNLYRAMIFYNKNIWVHYISLSINPSVHVTSIWNIGVRVSEQTDERKL